MVALPEFQAWSEYAICPESYCYKIPDEMTFHEAVAIAADGIVAYTLLFELGNLRRGKNVLIHSAPGGLVRKPPTDLHIHSPSTLLLQTRNPTEPETRDANPKPD